MAKKNKTDPALPYNPKARKDRAGRNSGGGGKLPGKRKVWAQEPGQLIRDGRKVADK